MIEEKVELTPKMWYTALMGTISTNNKEGVEYIWNAMAAQSFYPSSGMRKAYREYMFSSSLSPHSDTHGDDEETGEEKEYSYVNDSEAEESEVWDTMLPSYLVRKEDPA